MNGIGRRIARLKQASSGAGQVHVIPIRHDADAADRADACRQYEVQLGRAIPAGALVVYVRRFGDAPRL